MNFNYIRYDRTPRSELIKRADEAIISLSNGIEMTWFSKLLDILVSGNYATVLIDKNMIHPLSDSWFGNKEFVPVDVADIANTSEFASFFDIINHRRYLNMYINPIRTDKLSNSYRALYKSQPDITESKSNNLCPKCGSTMKPWHLPSSYQCSECGYIEESPNIRSVKSS